MALFRVIFSLFGSLFFLFCYFSLLRLSPKNDLRRFLGWDISVLYSRRFWENCTWPGKLFKNCARDTPSLSPRGLRKNVRKLCVSPIFLRKNCAKVVRAQFSHNFGERWLRGPESAPAQVLHIFLESQAVRAINVSILGVPVKLQGGGEEHQMPQNLKKISWASGPGTSRVWKMSRKSLFRTFRDFFQALETLSRLFPESGGRGA